MLFRSRKGQPLAEVYAPDWVAAQEEYLSVKRMQSAGTEALLAAARQRMLLAGMNDEQVKLVESSGKVQARFTLTAPIGGVIGELGAREGMTVSAGALLFRISGLGSVWIYAEVPESAAAQVNPGTPVEARTPSWPDRIFKGQQPQERVAIQGLLADLIHFAFRDANHLVCLACQSGCTFEPLPALKIRQIATSHHHFRRTFHGGDLHPVLHHDAGFPASRFGERETRHATPAGGLASKNRQIHRIAAIGSRRDGRRLP